VCEKGWKKCEDSILGFGSQVFSHDDDHCNKKDLLFGTILVVSIGKGLVKSQGKKSFEKISGKIGVSFKSNGILVESLYRSSSEDEALKSNISVIKEFLVPNTVKSFINSREERDKVNVKVGGGARRRKLMLWNKKDRNAISSWTTRASIGMNFKVVGVGRRPSMLWNKNDRKV